MLDELQCPQRAEQVGLLARGVQVGASGTLVASLVQVFRVQDRIPLAVPVGGAPVQVLALALQQRGIGGLLDQRVREQVERTLRPEQAVLDQVAAIEPGILQ